MRLRLLLWTCVLSLCLAVWMPVEAEEVVETWRSPFGMPRGVSVNSADRSVWAATGSSVMHLAASGAVLTQAEGFWSPQSVSVNPTDGSCWVADTGHGEAVHLSASGEELWRGGSFDHPWSVSVDLTDSSCWIADTGNDRVAHLGSGGAELWGGGGFTAPRSVSVNHSDGSCWVADTGANRVVHLGPNGAEVWVGSAFQEPQAVSVDSTDGSCWVADAADAVHLSHAGVELSRTSGFSGRPLAVAAEPGGGCWVADGYGRVWRLDPDGTIMASADWFGWYESALAVDPADGSCWVANTYSYDLVHLSADGTRLWSGGGLNTPCSVAVNPTDGSCWLADNDRRLGGGPSPAGEVLHLAVDGGLLWRQDAFLDPASVSVNATDSSCWLAETSPSEVHHFGQDGTEVWSGGGWTLWPLTVSANATDGSCWAGGRGGLVHLGSDGAVLWSESTIFHLYPPAAVSVNPTDGSCWVAGVGTSPVTHLNSDGEQLWAGGWGEYVAASVDAFDGSCWVAGPGVTHLGPDGSTLWQSGAFVAPRSLAVNAKDGSCWVVDGGSDEVVHLAFDGSEVWRGGALHQPESISVSPADGSCWVADTGNSQVVRFALVPSATAEPEFAASPTAGIAPLEVSFAALSTGEPTTWSWTFGDGSTSADQRVRHTFPKPGSYTISLTASGSVGTRAATREHYILATFPDVPLEPEEHWALHDIIGCVDAGIVAGYDDGLYHPDWSVTRDQMAVYVARALAGGEDYVPTGPAVATFEDVPTDNWAYDHVEYCCDQNVVQGYTATTYEPAIQVTRDQMAVYVARALVAPTGEAALADYVPASPRNFPDVPATGYGDDGTEPYWAYRHIEYCVEHGVVQGYGDGYYYPQNPVTRDQMAVYIARAFSLPI